MTAFASSVAGGLRMKGGGEGLVLLQDEVVNLAQIGVNLEE